MPIEKKPAPKSNKKTPAKTPQRGLVGYSKKSALLEEAITYMNDGKYGQSTAALKELLTLDPQNTEARRLFATLHLRLGSLVTARQAFESLANEAIGRQDYWLAESLLREYLAAGPRCVPFLELLAQVYEGKGDTMAAVGELGKAIDILFEDPIPDNPKKPSELYAKVRELEPASPVAFQFASLFDIQTGELLAPHHSVSGTTAPANENATVPSLDDRRVGEEDQSLSEFSSGTLSATQPMSPESPHVSPVIHENASVSLSTEAPSLEGGGGDAPLEENNPADAETAITSTIESPGLSAPMPWERIESATIKIEMPEPPVAAVAQTDDSFSLQEAEPAKPIEAASSEEHLSAREIPIYPSEGSHALAVDIPVLPVDAPVELDRTLEPASFNFAEAAPSVTSAPSIEGADEVVASVSSGSVSEPMHWNTGEVESQTHRPSDKKQNWDKEKGDATAVVSAPLHPVDSSPEAALASQSGGWEIAPSELVTPASAVPPPVETVSPQKDKIPEWKQASGAIKFVTPPETAPPVEKAAEAVSTSQNSGWEAAPSEVVIPALTASPPVETVSPQKDLKPEWAQASGSIKFVNLNAEAPSVERSSSSGLVDNKVVPEPVSAASFADVLIDSTGQSSQVPTQDRQAPHRPRRQASSSIGNRISSIVQSCFSTTRSVVMLCAGLMAASAVLVIIGIVAISLFWVVMEESPTPAYINMTASLPKTDIDSRKNGYFLLLGIDSPAERDPMQAGRDRKAEEFDHEAAATCMAGDGRTGEASPVAPADVVRGWIDSRDPAAQMEEQAESVRSWAAKESIAIGRYQQWLSMSFDDAGYGGIISPNCTHVLLAHRLYLAEGFAQDLSVGLDRLETDLGSWRVALGQSKTLMVKMLAVTAMHDDTAIASGLLQRQDLDGASLGRLGKMVRPLDQNDLSLQWPMQSHFVWATKSVAKDVKSDKANERPLYVAVAAAMPLPVQQRANAYADYYETANKAVAEGRYADLPKPPEFSRTAAPGVMDYLTNPIEHIIGIEPIPSWDSYVGRVVETEARLRLASLQALIKRGTQEGNVLTRLAKAGQGYYDPFTGLPMLVNQKKGLLYSVGPDGKDQDGDPSRDVAVTIPGVQSPLN